jgi:hypothetical protein
MATLPFPGIASRLALAVLLPLQCFAAPIDAISNPASDQASGDFRSMVPTATQKPVVKAADLVFVRAKAGKFEMPPYAEDSPVSLMAVEIQRLAGPVFAKYGVDAAAYFPTPDKPMDPAENRRPFTFFIIASPDDQKNLPGSRVTAIVSLLDSKTKRILFNMPGFPFYDSKFHQTSEAEATKFLENIAAVLRNLGFLPKS